MNTTQLAGRRIAVTGAARGIGLATAQELVKQGATVYLGDLDGNATALAASRIGERAHGFELNVADAASYAAFFEKVTADGPLDVLINNAGIMPIGRFVDQGAEIAHRAVEVNLLGVLNGMRLALPSMLDRGNGHIINIASTAGKAPIPGGITYCATKAGVVSLTEAARLEYAGSGVEFSCVIPHFTNTELISGTKATRLIPVVEAQDVASANAATIRKPRPEVVVPKLVGRILGSQKFFPRSLNEAVNRKLGAYDTFLHFDTAARAGYDRRIES